jgi:hypothetical protein
MQKGLIKLAYRQIIDFGSKGNFEKDILKISYEEFFMKSQAYNQEKKFKTFKEMVANDGKANSLHYKSGFAIGNLVEQLNQKIPDLSDALGKNLHFEMHKFEIIDSDITNPASHKVSITYFTGILTFFGNMGEYLLLAEGDKLNQSPTELVETFILKMREGLSVISYQPF